MRRRIVLLRGATAEEVSLETCFRCSGMQRSHVCFWRETDLWFRARCLEFDLLREPKRIVYFHP